jgi:hypothetical protein
MSQFEQMFDGLSNIFASNEGVEQIGEVADARLESGGMGPGRREPTIATP